VALAETKALPHLGPETTVGGTLTGQASKRGVARGLAGVADRTAAALDSLRQSYLLEVASRQLGRCPHLSPGRDVGRVTDTAYRAVSRAESWPRRWYRTR
jgi:hypothetical protein